MSVISLSQEQEQKLAQFGVQALYLFGSRAQAMDSPLSDYDYGVLMPERGHGRGDPLYFQLYDLLSEISPRTLNNDVIDIVFLRDAGLEIVFHVIRYGIVLYDGEPRARVGFEEKTVLMYCDFRPLLNEFDTNILKRL